MSIKINPVNNYQTFRADKTAPKKKTKDNGKSEKYLTTGLAVLGITAAAILALKGKKGATEKKGVKGAKDTLEKAKEITGKNPKLEQLTEEEKEKLIKKLQSKTTDEDVKAEIRKLVENGEWDKL